MYDMSSHWKMTVIPSYGNMNAKTRDLFIFEILIKYQWFFRIFVNYNCF